MEINNANIIITGGARGIGRELARQFSALANSVTIIDQNRQLLDQFPENKNVYKYTCDVTSNKEVEKTILEIFDKIEGVNVLINNAGVIHNEPLFNLLAREDKKHNPDNWEKVIDVNLNGVFHVTSNVVEQMIQRKNPGVIINISSISARGNVGQSAYSATKAAVEALTRTWSKELGMFKIRSACIAPGFFDTPSTRESLNDHMLRKWEKNVPLGRLGTLDELFGATKFIIENEYYNGKVLELDGGLTL